MDYDNLNSLLGLRVWNDYYLSLALPPESLELQAVCFSMAKLDIGDTEVADPFGLSLLDIGGPLIMGRTTGRRRTDLSQVYAYLAHFNNYRGFQASLYDIETAISKIVGTTKKNYDLVALDTLASAAKAADALDKGAYEEPDNRPFYAKLYDKRNKNFHKRQNNKW